MTVPPPVSPPGWYPDPSNPGRRIYWNGAEWVQPQASQDTGNRAAVAVGACLVAAVGFVMSMLPVSLMTGSAMTWTGVAIVAMATAGAFILRAATWVRIVTALVLAVAVINAVSIESQLSNMRSEFSQIFDR